MEGNRIEAIGCSGIRSEKELWLGAVRPNASGQRPPLRRGGMGDGSKSPWLPVALNLVFRAAREKARVKLVFSEPLHCPRTQGSRDSRASEVMHFTQGVEN